MRLFGTVALAIVILVSFSAFLHPSAPSKEKPALPAPPAIELDGFYKCKIVKADGKVVNAFAAIQKLREGAWQIVWYGLNTIHGVAVIDNDRLIVAYSSGDFPGLIRYKIEQKNGKPVLIGKAVTLAGGSEETLTWLADIEKE